MILEMEGYRRPGPHHKRKSNSAQKVAHRKRQDKSSITLPIQTTAVLSTDHVLPKPRVEAHTIPKVTVAELCPPPKTAIEAINPYLPDGTAHTRGWIPLRCRVCNAWFEVRIRSKQKRCCCSMECSRVNNYNDQRQYKLARRILTHTIPKATSGK